MSNKTVIVILAIAASLTAFIVLFERDTLSTSDREERKNRVFAEYKEDRVEALTLKHISGAEFSLKKTVSPADPDGEWSLTSPKEMKADQTEVDTLLSAFDYLLADRAVPAEKNLKDPRFGLETPRVQGSFTLMGKTTTFEIGADAEGEKVYLHTSQADDVIYAVNAEFLTSLDVTANDLRTKHLVDAPVSEASEVAVKRPIGDLSFTRKESRWEVQAGDSIVLAAADQVRELLSSVGALKAERFVADDVKPEKLGEYGLDDTATQIDAKISDKESVTVRIGSPCKDSSNLRYATVLSSGTVACVGTDLSTMTERPLLRFQETRLAPTTLEEITSVRISRGDKSLSFERKDSIWSMKESAISVDKDTLNELITAFTETRAKQLDTDAAAIAASSSPQASVTLSAGEGGEFEIEMYGISDNLVLARRKGEPALLRMPEEMSKWWDPAPLAFRDKIIRVGESAQIDRIEITGPLSQTLEKKDDLWLLSEPVKAAADMTAVRKITEPSAEIHVSRYVALNAESRHGFNQPFAVIKTRFAAHAHDGDDTEKKNDIDAAKTAVLELGAATEDGLRYARLRGTDETVFLVHDTFEYAIRTPLVARDLIQIDDTVVRKISFKTATAEKTFEMNDEDKWQEAGGTTADSETLERIVTDLSATKAVGAQSFGPADASFATPIVVITASAEGDKPLKTLTIGTKSENVAENAYTARADDLEITFLIPARIVENILILMGESSPADAASI